MNTIEILPTPRETVWFWSESSKGTHLQGRDSYVGWHIGHYDGGWHSMLDPAWTEIDGAVRFWMPLGLPTWSDVQRKLGARPHV